jgi:hypothetical protein
MRSTLNTNAQSRSRLIYRFAIFAVLLSAAVAAPLLSSAHPQQVVNITVTNNSSREIHHLYLSPVDQENWGPDQLNNTVVRNGESFTISSAACTGSSVKVIGEDQDGCFLSAVVQCSGDATWTITNGDAANCGN